MRWVIGIGLLIVIAVVNFRFSTPPAPEFTDEEMQIICIQEEI